MEEEEEEEGEDDEFDLSEAPHRRDHSARSRSASKKGSKQSSNTFKKRKPLTRPSKNQENVSKTSVKEYANKQLDEEDDYV